MHALSKTVVVVLMASCFGLGGVWQASAATKVHHKSCGAAVSTKTVACGKHDVKLKTKKPNAAGGKGISPGLLLLELVL